MAGEQEELKREVFQLLPDECPTLLIDWESDDGVCPVRQQCEFRVGIELILWLDWEREPHSRGLSHLRNP